MKAWRECGDKAPGILNFNISSSIFRWMVDKLIKMISVTLLSLNFFTCNKLFQNRNFSKQNLVTLYHVLKTHCTWQCKLWILLSQYEKKKHLSHYILQPTRCNFIEFIYFYRRCTCFRRFLRPSSGAHNCTYSFRYCQPLLLLAATLEEMVLRFMSSRTAFYLLQGSS